MNTEPDLSRQQTVRQPVPPYSPATTALPPARDDEADPLAKITMRPRTFLVVLASAALLFGLLLALLPVRVANADPAEPGHVTCGNTIGGVESGPLGAELDEPTQAVMATYVNTCESAVGTRLAYSWPLFFSGVLAIVWFGVVRQKPATPTVFPG